MIARIWHGYTSLANADAFEAMLKPEILPGIGNVEGFHHGYLLRRPRGTEVEFVTIMFWDSIESIKAIAGPDYERSIVPEERMKYLIHHDAKASHYDVAFVSTASPR